MTEILGGEKECIVFVITHRQALFFFSCCCISIIGSICEITADVSLVGVGVSYAWSSFQEPALLQCIGVMNAESSTVAFCDWQMEILLMHIFSKYHPRFFDIVHNPQDHHGQFML